MAGNVAIGVQSFAELKEENYFYIRYRKNNK